MSDNTHLAAKARTEFGKGAARRTRRASLIPATIHSHKETPVHISLPEHATRMALRTANALLEIDIEGVDELVLALAREVQRNPVRDWILHVDLQAVKAGERIEVEVPLRIEGEPTSGIAILDVQTVRVLAEATSLPELIVVDVEGRMDGELVHARDLPLPEGVELISDPQEMVVTITVQRAEIEETAEEAAEEAAEEEQEAQE